MISNLQIPAEYASGNRRLFGKDVDNVRCLVFLVTVYTYARLTV